MKHGSNTHDVFNQTPPLADYNLFATDLGLLDAVQREGAGPARNELNAAGAELGAAGLFEHARQANPYPPVLQTFSPQGRGIASRGYHSSPWAPSTQSGAHAARAACYLMQAQIESGTLCPTTMTYGAIAAMRHDPVLSSEWIPKLLAREYDPRDIAFESKRGGLIGLGMTEKQGGSDVRANTSRAVRSADGYSRIP